MHSPEPESTSSCSQRVVWSALPRGQDESVGEADAPSELLTQRQQTILAYWQELLPGNESGNLPLWADFDPLRIWTSITRLVVYEVLDEGNDLLFRLAGAEFERHLGQGVRGRRFSAISTPERLRAGRESARMLYQTPVPQLVHGWMEAGQRDHVTYSRLSVPFALEPGRRLGIILACYEFGANAPPDLSPLRDG